MSLVRESPVQAQLAALQPQWDQRCGMVTASRVAGDDAAKLSAVALADLSFLPKFGLKGPAAQGWLEARNVAIPPRENSWAALAGSGFIARLGRSEFFLEDDPGAPSVGALRTALEAGASGVYPVMRQDAGFAIAGLRVNELLAQTCNVNFEAVALEQSMVVMTQMTGVSVLILRHAASSTPCYRLWCDATFAPYFWETLSEIAAEFGGGIVGADALPG